MRRVYVHTLSVMFTNCSRNLFPASLEIQHRDVHSIITVIAENFAHTS